MAIIFQIKEILGNRQLQGIFFLLHQTRLDVPKVDKPVYRQNSCKMFSHCV
jgi:hypothetical protein